MITPLSTEALALEFPFVVGFDVSSSGDRVAVNTLRSKFNSHKICKFTRLSRQRPREKIIENLWLQLGRGFPVDCQACGCLTAIYVTMYAQI